MESTTANPPGKSPRVVKRYANRKLYDTRDSRYVTLQQIAEYVRAGEDVTIIDNTTKEDLTNATLAQIVYETEKSSAESGEEGRPKTMGALRSLIQNGGELFQSSSERLMSSLREGPVGKLIARRDAQDERAEEPKPTPLEESGAKAERKSRLLHPKEAIDELSRLADERVKVVLGTAIQSVHQLQGEVMRLHARIEELEQKLVEVQKRRGQAEDEEPSAREAGSPKRSERA